MGFADFLQDSEESPKKESKTPAPIRNNNPGALMPGGKLASFNTPEEGLKAIDTNLANYAKQGVDTLGGVISKWAPPNENDTKSYIAHAAKVTGLDPSQKIDLTNPLIRHQISAAIVQHENGTKAVYAPAANQSTFSNFLNDVEEGQSLPPTGAGAGRGSYAGFNRAEAMANKAPTPMPQPQKPSLGQQALANVLNLRSEAPAFAAKALDVVAGLPGAAARQADYWLKVGQGESPEKASQEASQDFASLMSPVGTITGQAEKKAYEKNAIGSLMNLASQGVEAVAKPISSVTGINPTNVQEAINTGLLVGPAVVKGGSMVGRGLKSAAYELEHGVPPTVEAGSVGAAATPTASIVKQAVSGIKDEGLKSELSKIPTEQIDIPTFQRHIEADSLPVPVRLTKGQATNDVVQLSHEQNLKGKNTEFAHRFNEQNSALTENLQKFREITAPDAAGSRMIDHGQALIDSYNTLDKELTKDIDAKYQALRDAAGGDFPVDAPKLLENINHALKKELLSSDAPASQFKEIQDLAKEGNMTYEQFLSLRRNLGDIARTASDGTTRRAAGVMIDELEKLPLRGGAAELNPLAVEARNAARNRFQMIEKDPAFKAVVDKNVAAEDFLNKFVIKGKNEHIKQMLTHLEQDPQARQHMAAGTLSYLGDRAGIRDISSGEGNFSQNGFNKAMKTLDEANKLPLIFDGETAEGLKTLGNVAAYTQFQPRGHFINNSNTLVARMAQGAKNLAVHGADWAAPGLQLGSRIAENAAERAARRQVQESLMPAAGIRQKKPSIMDLKKD